MSFMETIWSLRHEGALLLTPICLVASSANALVVVGVRVL